MLTSSWDVSEMPHKLSGSDEPPAGAAWRAGIPRHSPCVDETIRSRWTEPTGSHQSFQHEEQVILRESCFWRLLNCSWHCLGKLRFARKSQAF